MNEKIFQQQKFDMNFNIMNTKDFKLIDNIPKIETSGIVSMNTYAQNKNKNLNYFNINDIIIDEENIKEKKKRIKSGNNLYRKK